MRVAERIQESSEFRWQRKGSKDILQEIIALTVDGSPVGCALQVTVDAGEAQEERVSMRLDVSPIIASSHYRELPIVKVNALWHRFNQTLARELEHRRVDQLETGRSEILDLALASGKTNKADSPAKYFLVVRGEHAFFYPDQYFTHPEDFYAVLREQIVQGAERFVDFIQAGPVRAPETYALLEMLAGQSVQVVHGEIGDTLVWEETVDAGGANEKCQATIKLSEQQGELNFDAHMSLPQGFTRSDLAYLPINELNSWWQEVNRQLELSGHPRVDQIRGKGGRKLAIVFDRQKDNSDKSGMCLRVAETDEMGEPLEGAVMAYDYFGKATDFFRCTREMLSESFKRLQIMMRVGLVNNLQTYRILLSDTVGDLSTADRLADGVDLLTLSIGENSPYWMTMTLVVEDEPYTKDGLWKVRAGAYFGPAIEVPDIGTLDIEIITRLWNASCSRLGSRRSDIIARKGNRELRIVPRDHGIDQYDEQHGIFFTAVVVDSESGEIVTDEIIVNDWIPGDKVRAVDKIAQKMAGSLEQFYRYCGTELEEDARRLRAMAPVTEPWMVRTFEEDRWSSAFHVDISRDGVQIYADGVRVLEKVQAKVTFSGIERQFPIVMYYDPAGDGIGLVIELPSTLAAGADFASNEDIQKYLEAMQLLLQRTPMKIFPELDELVGGIKERCLPKFITKKEGEKTQVFLTMRIAPDELFALHTVGTCYWDEFIVWEMLGKAREAVVVWMKMLEYAEK